MPTHDWGHVDAGLFHAFRHRWLGALCDALNAEALPEDHFALVAETARARGAADRIAVRHEQGRIVAVVEIVSPGDKADEAALQAFIDSMSKMITAGVHVLAVDLFPPGPHDPQGIHKAIWDALEEEDFTLPEGKPLIVAAYDSGPLPVTYVEPVAAGDILPEMPLFVAPGSYVPAPLESSYQAAWDVLPAALKRRLASRDNIK
jgi:hypothetical protein